MALIVEDGTGKSDAESFCSVAFADDYWTKRPTNSHSATWLAAVTADKEGALRESTAYLCGLYKQRWPGRRKLSTQALDHPRIGAYDADGYEISSDSVHAAVINATAELAPRALAGALAVDQEQTIEREKIGPIETEYAPGSVAGTAYDAIRSLLSGLLQPTGYLLRG